jgi:hypothetical protein
MNWLEKKRLMLLIKPWFYWNLAFPVTLGRAIRDRRARQAEKKALSVG